MEFDDQKAIRIWAQTLTPVIVQQGSPKPLLIRLPFADGNRAWLKEGHRNHPTWNPKSKRWQVPVTWFDDVVTRALNRYGRVYVIQLYKRQQKCAPVCWNAKGFHCECSCFGANHGNGQPGGAWFLVSDTFAFSSGSVEYACRLLTSKKSN